MTIRLAILLLSLILSANNLVARNDVKHRAGLNLDFNGDTYSLGLSYHYMFCPWVGIGGGIGYFSHVSDSGLMGNIGSWWDDDYYGDYYYDDEYEPPLSFYVEPSVILRTPRLIGRGEFGIGLTARGSVRLGTNYEYTTGYYNGRDYTDVVYRADNISFGGTVGPTVSFGPVSFTIGYSISTIDINRTFDPGTRRFKREPVQGVFLDFAGYF